MVNENLYDKLSWDLYYLNMLDSVKLKSKDLSTKVGAIIVSPENRIVITGYNGFARNINDDINFVPERFERPLKYDFTLHAELNCLVNHVREGGTPIKGCKMYCSLHPCVACANAIVQSGIKEVITFDSSDDDLTRLSNTFNFDLSKQIFREGGVKLTFYKKEFIDLKIEDLNAI